MAALSVTCWKLIEVACSGAKEQEDEFARRYGVAIRNYLAARWRQLPLLSEIEDAAQEVLLECFRPGGLLDRVDPQRPGGFRPFLYGATRNVAKRFEERARRQREGTALSDVLANAVADETTLSCVFDRAYARGLLRQAFELLKERARIGDADLRSRVEHLQSRFRDGVPVRDIARHRNVDAKRLHRDLDRAKKEFRGALMEVVAQQAPNASTAQLTERCSEILTLVR